MSALSGPDPAFPELPEGAFSKIDQTEDADFYAEPRLVTHIDERAVQALTAFYRDNLPAGGVVLDLMSSWVSHLPEDVTYAEVIGHGMNATELAANPRFSRWFIRDFNQDPSLPLAEASVDAATLCVSIQYLQRPSVVLADISRVLRPGAPLLISFSNRCFPTKAVAVWRALDYAGQAKLVEVYLHRAGFTDVSIHRLIEDGWGDPMTVVVGHKP